MQQFGSRDTECLRWKFCWWDKAGKEIIAGVCKAGKGNMLKMFNAFEGCLSMHESKSTKAAASAEVISVNY